jgi:hypothetical protein
MERAGQSPSVLLPETDGEFFEYTRLTPGWFFHIVLLLDLMGEIIRKYSGLS